MNPTQEKLNIDAFNKIQTQQGTGNQYVSGQGIIPITPIPTTVSTDLIGNVQTAKLAPLPNPTTAVGFGAELTNLSQSGVDTLDKDDALKAEMEAARIKNESSASKSKKGIMDYLGLRKGESTLTNDAYSEKNQLGTTVDDTAKKVRDANNKILSIDIRQNEQLKQLNSTFQGTTQGKADASNAIIKNNASAKADLYIEKLMAQGDYDSAKSIADRKVDMLMEQDKLEYDKLMFDYEENKELFTKAEQREFELKASDRERKLNEESQTRKTFETTKIDLARSAAEQGASQSVKDAIARATTVEEAINAAGQYGGDILERQIKQAQLKKLNVDIAADQLKAIEENAQAISPYQEERQTRILSSVDELMGRTNFQTVGIPSVFKVVPGSIQRDFRSDLDTLKASIAFGELTAMREASRTGGALGSVSEKELVLLESALAGLDQGQSPANFRKNLEKVKGSIQRWQQASGQSSNAGTYSAGSVVEYQGKRYKVGADGDSLTEI